MIKIYFLFIIAFFFVVVIFVYKIISVLFNFLKVILMEIWAHDLCYNINSAALFTRVNAIGN